MFCDYIPVFQVHSYDFFTNAEEGYSRDYSEMTLHQVLRRLIRLLQLEIAVNVHGLEATRDKNLLVPPQQKPPTNGLFYPEELGKVKEYTDFFHKKALKNEAAKKNFMYKGAMRPADAMDVLFRGKAGDDLALYQTNKHAGACMHSKIGWKDTTATNDMLASSDPLMLQKV